VRAGEDVVIAQNKFYEALGRCSELKDEEDARMKMHFGSERDMFHECFTKAKEIYGDGLLKVDDLKNTDFQKPEMLIETVRQTRDKLQADNPKLCLIADMTLQWMQEMVDKKKMPLTPHHTQVRRARAFSRGSIR